MSEYITANARRAPGGRKFALVTLHTVRKKKFLDQFEIDLSLEKYVAKIRAIE